MKKHINKYFLTAGFVLWVNGCATMENVAPSETRPCVAIHYYPYTVAFCRTTAEPLIFFDSWNRTRMKRDLELIGASGVDVVIVSMNPEEAAHSGETKRYIEFVRLAGSRAKYPQVIFMAECYKSSKADIITFVDWCAAAGLENMPGYFKYKGLPLVEIYEGLKYRYIDNKRLTIRHTVWTDEWYWGFPADFAKTKLSRNGEQAMVFAGFLNNGDIGPSEGWKIPRRDGDALRERFRAAASVEPKFICVASWNDFWEGHFIEPNTLDGNKLYDVLVEEIGRLKGNYDLKKCR